MKATIFCFLFSIAASFVFAQPQKARTEKPNIVYILADDIGYGDIGCYGQTKIETPNLDALAKKGMLFTQHYAMPVCAPSRYCLMTGIHSGKAFIRGNDEWGQRGDVWSFKAMEENPTLEGQLPIPDSTITIAKLLKGNGYRTALVGKWGLGAPMTAGLPNNQGFDYFYGSLCQRQDHQYYPAHLWENGFRVPMNNKVQDPNIKFPANLDSLDPENFKAYSQKDYSPDLMLDAALRFLDSCKGQPFFLYYPSPLPHASMQAPENLVAYYHKKFGDEKPFMGGSYVPCRYPRATRAAMITLLDTQVGAIIDKLKKEAVYDNTIIIFSSDNGSSNEGGADCEYFDSNGPFRNEFGWGKGFLYEGGIRMPMIVAWPGKIKEGTKTDLISANWDFLPTACEIARIKPPKNIDGISFLPTLLSHANKQKKHSYLYWEFPQYGGQQAVRLNNWKGIRLNIQKGNMKIQLYDLDKDIQEQHDLAAQYPDIVEQINEIMKKEHHTPAMDSFRMEALEK
ncbi:MAG: arylsulfatase [Bacteroidetes bacterium]|nr:arylsulfatase [Bacteroidota bacterium]